LPNPLLFEDDWPAAGLVDIEIGSSKRIGSSRQRPD